MLVYGLARLGLFVALTVVIALLAWLIGAPVPLVMSALLALLVAFPLSMLIFPKMRTEATEAVGLWQQRRRQRKEWIREELAER
ncbi:membrane protein [Corynebacterium atypicum]|uniref:Membrane protein n=1 Tax=Corynebacterium atypicum TaxID=191610 RepID=A0ABN4DB85_9CORY|nr:membrane protein [Corynebacterium atypicum]